MFEAPDGGTHVEQIFLDPIHYEAPDGSMKLIDTDLHAAPHGFTNGANAFDAFFPNEVSTSRPITLDSDELSLAIVPVTTAVPAVAGDGTIRYPRVFPHTDLTYHNTVSGFTKFLTLQSPSAPSSFDFRVRVEGASLRRDPVHGVVLEDNGGEVVGYFPPGYAEDSSRDQYGQPARTFDVAYDLVDLGNGTYDVRITVPDEWLDAPERIYPVNVDPSVVLCKRGENDGKHCTYESQPNKDTFATTAAPNKVHTGLFYLAVQNDTERARSFLKFETQSSSLQLGNLIYQADFHIRSRYSAALATPKPVDLQRINEYWNASELTWLNQPVTDAFVYDTVRGCGANATACLDSTNSTPWHVFDAEDLLQKAFFDPNEENNGFRLKVPDGYTNTYKEFDSKNAELTNRRPYLIMFTNAQPDKPVAVSPAPNADIETDTPPELKIEDVTDRNGDSVEVNYQVAEDSNFTNIIDQSGWVAERQSYTPSPEGGNDFDEGGTYYWRVLARDGYPTKDQPYPRSDTRSFTMQAKKRGTDPRWGMWDYELGNDMVVSVNQATGNFVLEYPLDTLAAPGGELDVNLSYNSQAAKGYGADEGSDIRGPAKGWEISAGPGAQPSQIPVRIDPLDASSEPYGVAVVYDSGRRDTYAHAGGGVYKAIGPLAGTLHHLQDGRWDFTSYTGGQYTFTRGGDLASARPSTSTPLEKGFSYELNTLDPDRPRIKYVRDETNPSERNVYFDWNGDRLNYVQAVGGRRWDFTYDAGGRLESIRDPDGSTVELGYSDHPDFAGLLNSIQDGQSVAYERDGDPTTAAFSTRIDYLARDVAERRRFMVDKVVLPGPRASMWDFNYTSFFNDKGSYAKTTQLIAPHPADVDADYYKTTTDFDEAGLPIKIVQPPMSFDTPIPETTQPDVFPTTIQEWSGTGNLICRREPLANKSGVPQDCISPESSVYDYDNEAPYLLQKVTEPRAETGAERLVTTHVYDERDRDFSDVRADYWNNQHLEGLADGVDLAPIAGFGSGGPPAIGGKAEDFSIRWTGQVKASHAGAEEENQYSFRARLDHGYGAPKTGEDGVRVVVGDKLLVNCWPGPDVLNEGCSSSGGSVQLSGTGADEDDGWHTIVVEFTHNTGNARLDLEWKPKDGVWSSIDPSFFRPHLGVPTTTKVGIGGDAARFSETTYKYESPDGSDDYRLRALASSESLSGANTATQKVDYTYDRFGRTLTEVDATTKAITHDYAGVCEVRTVDRVGLETTRTCNDAGDVLVETVKVDPQQPAKDRDTTTTYTRLGRVDTVENPDDGVTDNAYFKDGRLKSELVDVEADDSTTPDVNEEKKRLTTYTYTPEGWLDVETLPSPSTSGVAGPAFRDYDYDLAGNETAVTDANGHTWRYRYNGVNLRVAKISPSGDTDGGGSDQPDTWTWTYDLAGNVVKKKDPAGVVVERTYDLLSRTQTERTSSSSSDVSLRPTSYDYDPRGNVIREEDATGVVVTKSYDAADRVREETRAVGAESSAGRALKTTVTHYDAAGNNDRVTDFRGNTTSYGYDPMGRLERVTLPPETANGAEDVFTYDHNKAGEIIHVEARRGDAAPALVVDYAYDLMGRKRLLRDALGNETTYAYNLAGGLTSVRDPRAILVQHIYDGMGRKSERRAYESTDNVLDDAELINRELFTHDWESQMLSASSLQPATLPDQTSWRRVEIDHDDADRLDEVRSCELLVVDQDPSCALDAAQHDSSDYTYENDQLVSRNDSAVFGTTSYAYDAFGRLKTVTDPFTGQPTTFGYDDAGRVVSRCDSATTLYHEFSHDTGSGGAGWLERERVERTQPACDNPNNPDNELVAEFAYDYNENSDVTFRSQFIERSADNGTWTYDYFKSGYLKSADFDAGATPDTYLDYDYDAAGNRAKVVTTEADLTSTTYTYFNAASRPVRSTKTTTVSGVESPEVPYATYAHDAVGNMTEASYEDRQLSYTYDGYSRVTRADVLPDALLDEDPATIGWVYDGLDRNVAKELTIGDATAEVRIELAEYVYAGTDEAELVAERTAVDLPEPEPDPELKTTAMSYAAGAPLALRRITAATPTSLDPIRFYGIGPHGDVSYLSDAADLLEGETVASRTYDPWGEVRSEVEDATGVLDQAVLGFQGDPTDVTTGLVDMGARHYDPALGRFMTNDPLEPKTDSPLSYNPYLYGLSDPVTMTDPTGMDPCCGRGGKVPEYNCDCPNDRPSRTVRQKANPTTSSTSATQVAIQYVEIEVPTAQELYHRGLSWLPTFDRRWLRMRMNVCLHARHLFRCLYPSVPEANDSSGSSWFQWINQRSWDIQGWWGGQVSKIFGASGWECAENVRCYNDANWLHLAPIGNAVTVGHTVFCENTCSPSDVRHEVVHVRDYETEGITYPYRWAWQAIPNGVGCENPWERPAYVAGGGCPGE